MANKIIFIKDLDEDEIIKQIDFTGECNIAVSDINTEGNLRHYRGINNARFNEKMWIMNWRYALRCKMIVEKLEAFKHINPRFMDVILFLEDTEWEEKASMKKKAKWKYKVAKASKQLEAMTGYTIIITTRKYYTEDMNDEQLNLLFYGILKHFNQYGEIDICEIEEWPEVIATFGPDWATPHLDIPDILEPGFKFKKLSKNQLSMFDEKVIPFREAAEM